MNEGNALAVVKAAKDKGALVFANIENMEAKVDLYRTEVTEITFAESDFHTINSKSMPNKAATDRIGEACGVQFIQAACRVTAETRDDTLCGKRTVYRAEAQGKIRMPDGSWRTSTVDEYEFDPVLRAMLDKNVAELNEKTKPLVGKAILEYTKVARQRAATGARLRVIRQLTGMPGAFEKADAIKPFVFTRVVQNTDYILKTPEGRAMATAQALGWDAASLFGARKNALPPAADNAEEPYTPAGTIEPGNENNAANLNAEAGSENEPDFPPDTEGEAQKETEFDRLTFALREYMSFQEYLDVTTKSGINPYKLVQEELASTSATEESRTKMIKRIREYLIAKQIPGVV
jgi:hypothetical protein